MASRQEATTTREVQQGTDTATVVVHGGGGESSCIVAGMSLSELEATANSMEGIVNPIRKTITCGVYPSYGPRDSGEGNVTSRKKTKPSTSVGVGGVVSAQQQRVS